jgi:alpha-1,2-mannosyltransferase
MTPPDKTTAAIGARIAPVSLALILGYVVALCVMAATANGVVDAAGRPLGTDFSSFWSAGRLAASGAPEAVYDYARLHATQREAFGPAAPFYPFPYPPLFLVAAAALALLPYLPSLVLWQASTFALYLFALAKIVDARVPLVLLAGAAFPAVFVNLIHGQTGFLSAGLFSLGLLILDRRPALAGTLLGLIAFKPQFGLLLPFVLVATGRWRAAGAATATVAATAAGSWLLLGGEAWSAFLSGASVTRTVALEAGAAGWHKIMSAFAAARGFGAPSGVAYAVQACLSVMVAVLTVRTWRSDASHGSKAAALLAGSLLATPYALDYDMALLAPAIAFLVRDALRSGWRRGEAAILAFAFLAPLFARPVAEATSIPVGLLAIAGVFAVAVARGLSLPAPARTHAYAPGH